MLRAWLAMSPGWPAGAGPMSPSSFILISLFTMRSYRAAMKSWRGGEGGGGGKCDECQTRFQRRRFRGDASSSPTLFSPPPPPSSTTYFTIPGIHTLHTSGRSWPSLMPRLFLRKPSRLIFFFT